MDTTENRMKFSEETKKNIAKSGEEIKLGKTISLNKVKKKIGIGHRKNIYEG